VRNIEENITTNQVLKNEDFLGTSFIVLHGKITANARYVKK